MRGVFVGYDNAVKSFGEKETITHYYLIVDGTDSYKISSDKQYNDKIAFGDLVTFKIKPRAYNNTIYYNGVLYED